MMMQEDVINRTISSMTKEQRRRKKRLPLKTLSSSPWAMGLSDVDAFGPGATCHLEKGGVGSIEFA
jgi:hypothetical protein